MGGEKENERERGREKREEEEIEKEKERERERERERAERERTGRELMYRSIDPSFCPRYTSLSRPLRFSEAATKMKGLLSSRIARPPRHLATSDRMAM